VEALAARLLTCSRSRPDAGHEPEASGPIVVLLSSER